MLLWSHNGGRDGANPGVGDGVSKHLSAGLRSMRVATVLAGGMGPPDPRPCGGTASSCHCRRTEIP